MSTVAKRKEKLGVFPVNILLSYGLELSDALFSTAVATLQRLPNYKNFSERGLLSDSVKKLVHWLVDNQKVTVATLCLEIVHLQAIGSV